MLSNSDSPVASVTAINTARQPNGTMISEPTSGASIGEIEMTSMTVDISRVALAPV